METTKALRQAGSNVWHALRCRLCEEMIHWALKVAPAGYTPSVVEACVDAYRRQGSFANIKHEDRT